MPEAVTVANSTYVPSGRLAETVAVNSKSWPAPGSRSIRWSLNRPTSTAVPSRAPDSER